MIKKKSIFLILLCIFFVIVVALVVAYFFAGSRVKVKDILVDEKGYEIKNFYPNSLPKKTFLKINNSDYKKLSFKKIIVVANVVDNDSRNNGTTSGYKLVSTISNAGGSFVQTRNEYMNNDIPYRIMLTLSYRGIFILKMQRIDLWENKSEALWRVDDVESFTPITSAAKEIGISGVAKPVKPEFINTTCKVGDANSAAAVFESLEGDYVPISCRYFNENGSVAYTAEYSYLKNYGVAIPRSMTSVSVATQFHITSVEVSQ